MPIVVVFEFPGEDVAKYHRVFEVGGPSVRQQPKRLDHICYRTESGFNVVDVWADRDSFAAFGEIIGPVLEKAGLDARPSVHELEATMAMDGTRQLY